MKKLLSVLAFFLKLFIIGEVLAQSPVNFPVVTSNGYYKYGFVGTDSGFIFKERDTFRTKYPTLIKHINHRFYYTNGLDSSWHELIGSGIGSGGDDCAIPLDEVLAAGNTATGKDIILKNGSGKSIIVANATYEQLNVYSSDDYSATLSSYELMFGNNTGGIISLKMPVTINNSATLRLPSLPSFATRTIPISVNGLFADANGAITGATLVSSQGGLLLPKMTAIQAEAIVSPEEGLMIYITGGTGTTIISKGWWGFDGTTWVKLN